MCSWSAITELGILNINLQLNVRNNDSIIYYEYLIAILCVPRRPRLNAVNLSLRINQETCEGAIFSSSKLNS